MTPTERVIDRIKFDWNEGNTHEYTENVVRALLALAQRQNEALERFSKSIDDSINCHMPSVRASPNPIGETSYMRTLEFYRMMRLRFDVACGLARSDFDKTILELGGG